MDYHSLWNDELSTWHRSSLNYPSDVIRYSIYNDIHPPGYQLLVWGVIHWFGDSEWWLRFPSAVAGILSIGAIYGAGRSVFDQPTGIIASSFTACSGWLIYYSQEARSYSMLFLLAILITWVAIYLINNYSSDKKPSILGLISISVLLLISSFIHYFGMLLVGIAGLLLVIPISTNRRLSFRYILPFSISLALWFIWIPGFIQHLQFGPVYIEATEPQFLFQYFRQIFGESNLLAISTLLISGAGILALESRKPIALYSQHRNLIYSGLFVLLPYIIGLLVSWISYPLLTFQNMLIAAPATILVISYLISRINNHLIRYFSTAAICLGMLYSFIFEDEYYISPQKQQFREAVSVISNHEQNTDNPLIFGYVWSKSYIHYYLNQTHPKAEMELIAGSQSKFEKIRELAASSNRNTFWYIYAHRRPKAELLDQMIYNYELKKDQKFKGARVMKFGLVD